MIVWAGTRSDEVGMIVEHYPRVVLPQRKFETQTVPGRNGDIVLSEGAFQNYDQEYQVFLDSKYAGGLETAMPRIVDWLLGHDGYQRLEDSYFPDFYRMARFDGGTQFFSFFNEYGEGTLTFSCAPEKFYRSGEKPVALTTSGTKLRNPSGFKALPLFKVNGSGYGKLYVDSNYIEISNITNGFVMIDVKTHQAYNGTTNRSNTITGDFDNLKLGPQSSISWSNGVTSVEVTPRWWTI